MGPCTEHIKHIGQGASRGVLVWKVTFNNKSQRIYAESENNLYVLPHCTPKLVQQAFVAKMKDILSRVIRYSFDAGVTGIGLSYPKRWSYRH